MQEFVFVVDSINKKTKEKDEIVRDEYTVVLRQKLRREDNIEDSGRLKFKKMRKRALNELIRGAPDEKIRVGDEVKITISVSSLQTSIEVKKNES